MVVYKLPDDYFERYVAQHPGGDRRRGAEGRRHLHPAWQVRRRHCRRSQGHRGGRPRAEARAGPRPHRRTRRSDRERDDRVRAAARATPTTSGRNGATGLPPIRSGCRSSCSPAAGFPRPRSCSTTSSSSSGDTCAGSRARRRRRNQAFRRATGSGCSNMPTSSGPTSAATCRYSTDVAADGQISWNAVGLGQITMPRRRLLTHVFLHEIRHLAQLALAARAAGIEPPGNHDLFLFEGFARLVGADLGGPTRCSRTRRSRGSSSPCPMRSAVRSWRCRRLAAAPARTTARFRG